MSVLCPIRGSKETRPFTIHSGPAYGEILVNGALRLRTGA